MPVKEKVIKQDVTSANGNQVSESSNFKQYHFMHLRVGPQAMEGQVYSAEQVALELSSWLQDEWVILNASEHLVPVMPGQSFAGWYCAYHLVKL